MATKWKKWKGNLACISFVLGASLLITGGVGCARWLRINGSMTSAWQMLNAEDYQNSGLFRNFIENQLDNFLDMACGNAVYDDYYSYYDDGIRFSYQADAVQEGKDAVSEMGSAAYVKQVQEEEATADIGGLVSGIGEEYWQEGLTNEQKKESILKYHNAIKDDKNLLYSICYSDKELYSNRFGSSWDGTENGLPEGYNFCLRFDGTKVTIKKDGEELDIYGDGIYREGSSWCVPGYRNFSGKEWKDADILLLVAADPTPFLKSMGDRYSYGYGNGLYQLYQEYTNERSLLLRTVFCMAAGIVLLALYLFLRNVKGEFSGRAAGVMSKIWFEAKVFFCLLVPIAFFLGILAQEGVFYRIETACYYGAAAYEYASELSYAFLDGLAGHPVAFLAVFWLFYLFVVDLRRNKGSYKNGIFYKFITRLDSRGLALSVSVRMIKRTYVVFVLTCILFLYTFCMFAVSLLYDVEPMTPYGQMFACALVCLLFFAEYVFQRKNREVAQDIGQLAEQISGIRSGNYKAGTAFLVQDNDLQHMAEELEDIRQGLENAVEERIHSERMKVELVANVSHDIKTPLTSIISYIKLLKQEEGLPDYVTDYIRILDEKSERLKNMVQDVFAVSKAASGQLTVEYKELDLGKLLYQTLADMEELIKKSPVTVKAEIPKKPVMVCSDGQRMYRVFLNLIGNAVKYSLEGSRVYVALKEEGGFAVASVTNTSSQELDRSVDFAERFIRGDESRTDGGSGLGLSIAKSFTEACGGTFELEIIADLFVVRVLLPGTDE